MPFGVGVGLGIGAFGLGSVGRDFGPKRLLLVQEFLEIGERSLDGAKIKCLSIPWIEIYKQLETNPDLLHQFSNSPDAFEQFMAGAYDRAGFLVTLTPRSGDGGKGIIAEKKGFGAIRILDQCKAYSENSRVGQNDVRAILGVLGSDLNASKAVLTTTSEFAPGIATDPAIQQFVPYRLELRDKNDVMSWLRELA